MRITNIAKAGTLESNDVYIVVEPIEGNTVEIDLESIVLAQFGKQIHEVLNETASLMGMEGIRITAKDRGALDYTIKARLETAIRRAI